MKVPRKIDFYFPHELPIDSRFHFEPKSAADGLNSSSNSSQVICIDP